MDEAEYAERVNAAAELARSGISPADAASRLADQYGVSRRQARRYVERAAASGRVEVPEASVVFTVRLPASLAARVREHARVAGLTISAVVAGALADYLAHARAERSKR